MVVVSLWIYEADWFAVFMDLLVLVGLGRVCFGVKRGEEGGVAGQWRGFLEPPARVNICRGSPDKN